MESGASATLTDQINVLHLDSSMDRPNEVQNELSTMLRDEDIVEQNNNNSIGSSQRKGRGLTVGLALKKKTRGNEKLDIVIHPRRNRIVGENAKDFKTECCVLIRQHVSHLYPHWKDVPADMKRKVWLGLKRDIETGEEPTRTSTWRKTRYCNKKHEWVDQASRDTYEEIIRLQSEPNEEGQDVMNEDDAFIQVLGEEKPSRMRGCGDGLKPPSKAGGKINIELERENEDLRKQVEEDKESLDVLKAENKSMAARLVSLEDKLPHILQSLKQISEVPSSNV